MPPVYIDNTLKLGKGISKFSGMGPSEDTSGISTQYIEAKFDLSDKNAITYIGTNYAIPKLDEKTKHISYSSNFYELYRRS